jgi:hypothetical protein
MYTVRIQTRKQDYRKEWENMNMEQIQKGSVLDEYRKKLNQVGQTKQKKR